jgi:thioredoxin reductase
LRAETALHADAGFVVRAGDQRLHAATIILATGIVDQHPDFEGLREATLKGAVRWCPICDGFEILDQESRCWRRRRRGLPTPNSCGPTPGN